MAIRIQIFAPTKEGGKEKINDQILDKKSISIGSQKKHDVCLSEFKNVNIIIEKGDESGYLLKKKSKNEKVKINDLIIEDGETTLRNGDLIQIENYQLRFNIQFDRASHSRKIGLISYLSTALILSILIAELSILVILPKKIENLQIWSLEVVKQRTLELLDNLRYRCSHPDQVRTDPFYIETVKLLANELDKMATYLRRYEAELQTKQITELYRDISSFEQILNHLEDGSLYPQRVSLETQIYCDMIIMEAN